jgi:hypothetical protein
MVSDFEGSGEVVTHSYGDGCPETHGKHRLGDGCPGGHRGVSTAKSCSYCDGKGDVWKPLGVTAHGTHEDCPACDGHGTITPCPKCDGMLEIGGYWSVLHADEPESGPLTHWQCSKCTYGEYT